MTTVDEPATTDVEELESQLSTVTVHVPGNTGAATGYVAGDQIINLAVKRLREAQGLGDGLVRRTLATLVERGYRTNGSVLDGAGAERILRANHRLILIGDPDTGRRTAAVAVLGRLGLPLQQIPTWEPGQPSQFTVPDLPATPNTGYLFRHPASEVAAPDFIEQLRAYVDRLSRIGSYLVVLVSATEWHAVGGGSTADDVMFVGPPDPHAVLDAELAFRPSEHDLGPVLGDPRIRALIDKATPRDVVRLAELILATAALPTRDQQPELRWKRVVQEIVGASQEWTAELAAWFRRHTSAHERVFLLTAAVLEGAPAGLVLRHAELLAESLGSAPSGRHDITAAGIRELAGKIGAEVSADGGRLRFRRPAFGVAVIDFYLADRSETFRAVLRDWFAKAPTSGPTPEATTVAGLVAAAVLDIVLRHRDIRFLLPIVDTWATHHRLRPALVSLLTGAALSREIGSPARQRLNFWAANSTSPNLCRVVAEVCSGELADAYPQIALTRINNLARRASGARAEAVVTAVLRLWERPPRQRDVLERIMFWLSDPDSPAFAVAVEVLAVLGAEPIRVAHRHRLEIGPALRSLLRLPDGPPEQLRDTFHGWFDLAVDDVAFGEWFIAALTDAVPGPAPALTITSIRLFSREWQGPDVMTARGAFRVRLLNRLETR